MKRIIAIVFGLMLALAVGAQVTTNTAVTGVQAARGQLPASITNDSAAAGNVGEFVDSFVSAQTTTTGIAPLTSISLTAGDWDVSASVESSGAGAATFGHCGISQSNNSYDGSEGKENVFAGISASVLLCTIPRIRKSLASTTTVYLNANSQATLTTAVQGYISARRVR